MSVQLQFDISDIWHQQPFHQRCSELPTEGRSGILTKLLLKAVADIPWLLRLGDIPNSSAVSLFLPKQWPNAPARLLTYPFKMAAIMADEEDGEGGKDGWPVDYAEGKFVPS